MRKHELRSRFSAVYPGVYLPRTEVLSFRQRVEAAWLWSDRGGVLSGLTAARFHGAKWIDDALPIELIWRSARPPKGISVFRGQLRDGEQTVVAGLPVTTVARTAFDVGRRGRIGDAVARLDALGNATGIDAAAITEIASHHRGSRGMQQLLQALTLYDPGAQSPKETWLRLLVMKAGFPRPRTQLPVGRYFLDMGWEELRLAIEYEGDHHRTDRQQFARDIARLEELVAMGWTIIRVAADTPPHVAIASLRRAWASRVH